MMSRGLRERLFHGRRDSDSGNWAPASPLGGNRPFPVPPTPTDSSASVSGDDDGAREKTRKHKSSRSGSRHRHRHHHRHHRHRRESEGERINIDDEPMPEGEKLERRGIMKNQQEEEDTQSESSTSDEPVDPGGGVRIPKVVVERTNSKRRSRKEAPSSPQQGTPEIRMIPATPDGDPLITGKRRRSTTPVPFTNTNAFSVLPSGQPVTKSRSRSSSLAAKPTSSAAIPIQRVQMPPFPETPPFVDQGSGYGYFSVTPPSISSLPQRFPTVLRAGSGQPKHQSNDDAESFLPELAAIEVDRSHNKPRRSESLRTAKHVSWSQDGTSTVSTTSAAAEDPPSSPRSPASYRDSILSTFSNHPDTIESFLTNSPENSTDIPISPAARRPTRTSSTHTENYLSILKNFDTIFLIDDSPSMLYKSRWPDTASAIGSISAIATQYDTDGIDIHFLNSPEKDVLGVHSRDEVTAIFNAAYPRTGGSTPLGARLDSILRTYLDRYALAREEAAHKPDPARYLASAIKPLNVVVITDGDATDDPESVIVSVARELDRLNAPLAQVGIQMFQVGNDPEASEFLRGLDDDLVHVYGIRDIVDTTPYTGSGERHFTGDEILKVLVGGINRRIDRRENSMHT